MPKENNSIEIHLRLKDRFKGCLYGMVLGEQMSHSGTPLPVLSPSCALTLSVGEALTQESGRKKVQAGKLVAEKYLEWSSTGQKGYWSFEAAIKNLKSDKKWEKSGVPTAEWQASLLATTLGLLYHAGKLDEFKSVVLETTSVVQTDTLALAGALTQAFSMAYLALASSLDKLFFIQSLVEFIEPVSSCFSDELKSMASYLGMEGQLVLQVMQPQNSVLESYPAALYCFMKSPDNFGKTLDLCLKTGEGATAIATIAGALSGAYLGYGSLPASKKDAVPEKNRIDSLVDALLAQSLDKTQA